MKNTTRVTIASIFLLTLSASVLAEKSLSYDYVEAGAIRFNIKPAHATYNYDGYILGGVKEVSDNVHVFASYADTNNANINLDFKTIGAGLHHSISSHTDIVFDLSRVNYSLNNSSLDLSASGNFNTAELSARHLLLDDLEFTAGFTKWGMKDNSISYSGFGVGAIKKISDELSVKFDYKNLKISQGSEDVNPITLSLRHYY